MDDLVKQAMVKWPNVPHCYGWLGLDARGQWYMRDDRVQALGPFAGGTLLSKGAVLKHEKLIEFIHRNYDAEPSGQWYFQNGPQRVYVELEATPLIWRVDQDWSIHDHCGRTAMLLACFVDELGRVFLLTDVGFGLVHTMDMNCVADAVEQGLWQVQPVNSADLAGRFNYIASPLLLSKQ